MNDSQCLDLVDEGIIFDDFNCSQTLSYKIIANYLTPIVQIVSILYTVVCIVVFWKIIRHEQQHIRNGNMFNYLFLKSVFDFLSLLSDVSRRISSLEIIKDSYISQIIYIWIYFFINSVVITIAIYIEIFATFDCFLVLNNFLSFFKSKKSYYINLIVLVIVSFSVNVILLFNFDIIKVENKFPNVTTSNDNSYRTSHSCFYRSILARIITEMVIVLRDFAPSVLLFIINILIVLTLKKINQQKRTLNVNISEVNRAQTDKTKMMFAVSFSLIIGRVPYMVYILPIHGSNFFWECTVFPISNFLYFIPILLQIIFYYRFNKIFQKYLKF
jgi:hypothetical protein